MKASVRGPSSRSSTREGIPSQELLGQRLAGRGFDVTQATLSRDIKELGLVKRAADGAYQRPNGDGPGAPPPKPALRRAAASTCAAARWCRT